MTAVNKMFCQCSCGQQVNPGSKYIRGHSWKWINLPTEVKEKRNLKISLMQQRENNSNWKGGTNGYYFAEKLFPEKQPCILCSSIGTERYHKDKNLLNNTVENIQWLCRKCLMATDGRADGLRKRNKETPPNLGKHQSGKTKSKIGKANMGKRRTEQTKQKIREKAIGRRHSIEEKQKMSIRMKKYIQEHPEELIRLSLITKGENNSHWQGGKSFEPYTSEFNRELRQIIRRRDNHTCQLCGVPECECIENLSIHHIDYNKKNNSSDNLVALCRSCNAKVNRRQKVWTNYFLKKNPLQLPLRSY